MWQNKLARALFLAALLVASLWVALRAAKPWARRRLSDFVRQRSIDIVRERFEAEVSFDQFTIAKLYPRISITGARAILTKPSSLDSPPLIFIENFSLSALLLEFLGNPSHVEKLVLTGMRISVPPRREPETGERNKSSAPLRSRYPVIIDGFECHDCELNILPRNPAKRPLEFSIHQLSMQNLGLGRSAPYIASLTNAVPKGEIEARGQFGPWQPDEPSLTPLSGNYRFSHADLDPFPGIGGTLDSSGQFQGVLERIVADGRTSTPDFSLDVIGRPVPLETEFHATIDGTSGDTALDPVKARLVNARIVARGAIFGTGRGRGRAVLLDVVVMSGRLEDILRLAVKASPPPLIGGLRLHAELAVLPGPGKVLERLKMNGRFFTTAAQPTNPETQKKLALISRRAEGRLGNPHAGSDMFNLNGRFLLNHAQARFPQLSFTIPGARMELAGTYGLRSERLEFTGDLQLDAKLSQTVPGFKSLMLKPFDPFFRKQGKTVLPIAITGMRSDPKFHLMLRRAKHRPL